MDKIKSLINKIKNYIIEIYTGSHSVMAAVITITAISAITVASIVIVKNISAKEESATETESQTNTTTEEETTTYKVVVQETTTEITTEETTTEAPTTTTEPATTIPIELISTTAQDDVDIEENLSDMREQMTEPEPAPEPTTEPVTEPETEPIVAEEARLVHGIDVSYWQGNIDWAKVKADGIEFAIIKACGRSISSPSLYEDKYFRQNIEGALANGVQVGVYVFSTAITETEAIEEASYILSLISDYKITYPVVFDWEAYGNYRNATAGLTKAQRTKIVQAFCNTVQYAGYTPMVYTNLDHLKYKFNGDELCSSYRIWLANYFSKYNDRSRYQAGDSLPNTDYTFQMWQYSSKGKVDGISTNVDMNIGFFTYYGSEVPSTNLKLNITNKSLTTNKGTALNLLDGVTASNTAGLNVSSSVTYTVKNSSGTVVDSNNYYNTPGTYTVEYKIKDFSGATKTDTSTVIVRDIPTLIFDDTLITAGSVTLEAFTENDINTLKQYIKESKDYEGNPLLDAISIDTSKLVFENGNLPVGNYEVTYSVSDSKGLSNSIKLLITIPEPETSGEDNSGESGSDESGSGESGSGESGSGESGSDESGSGESDSGESGSGGSNPAETTSGQSNSEESA